MLASQQQFKALDVEVREDEGHIGASVSLISQYSTTPTPDLSCLLLSAKVQPGGREPVLVTSHPWS